MVGLASTLCEVFDLIIFHGDFGAKKNNKTVLLFEPLFQLLNVLGRDQSRQVGAGRAILSLLSSSVTGVAVCRGSSHVREFDVRQRATVLAPL